MGNLHLALKLIELLTSIYNFKHHVYFLPYGLPLALSKISSIDFFNGSFQTFSFMFHMIVNNGRDLYTGVDIQ